MAKIFISYSSKDKAFARRLSEDLNRMGHEPWLDEWEIKVGECIITKIDRGVADSDFVVIILSSHSVTSGWVEKEWKTKYWYEIDTGRIMVLPVLVEECEIPVILKTKKYADFRPNYAIGFVELVAAIDQKILGYRELIYKTKTTSRAKDKFELYFWHKGVQEYFGQSLHLMFVRYKSGSILFKKSVLQNLNESGIRNYLIFELFSGWDILIRLWATDELSSKFIRLLEDNADIKKVDTLRVKRMEHIYDEEIYPPSSQITRVIDNIGLNALLDIQDKGDKSEHFENALADKLLLEDKLSFDPEKIQFYVVIRSLENLGEAVITNILDCIKKFTSIKAKTIYITMGTSIRMILKGQATEYYQISDFLTDVTSAFALNDIVISTETVLVANRNVKSENVFDFQRAEEETLERQFDDLLKSIKEPSYLSLEDKYNLLAKFTKIRDILLFDDQDILLNLLKAKISKSTQYIKQIKDFFPHFEQSLKDHLPKVISKEYDNDWQEVLDSIKESESIAKNKKADELVIGDLSKIYKHIINEKKMIDYKPVTEKEFNVIMDELPGFRNILAHTGASLRGWDKLFDFCRRFIPVRAKFMNYFSLMGK